MSYSSTSFLRILHVEDDPSFITFVREAVATAPLGMELDTVETLSAARSRLADPLMSAYDVVLLDLRLPDARGTEAIETLKVYGVPIVVLSASSSSEVLKKAAAAGAADYLVKGVSDASMLLRRLRFNADRHAEMMKEKATRSPFARKRMDESTFSSIKPFISCAALGRV